MEFDHGAKNRSRGACLPETWTVTVCVLSCLLSSVSAELTVKSGDDVTLHCQTPRDKAVTVLTWTRPDLKTDEYVFFYRDGLSYEQYQHPSLRGRVQLKDPQMKDGDVSVVLKNTNTNDAGTYQCKVSVMDNEPPVSTITLKVTGTGDEDGNTETGGRKGGGDEGGGEKGGRKKDRNVGLKAALIVGVLLLFVAASVGFMFYRIHKARPDPRLTYTAVDHQF